MLKPLIYMTIAPPDAKFITNNPVNGSGGNVPYGNAPATPSTASSNGVYVIDGYNGTYMNTNNAYDPSTNTWTAKAGDLTARYYLAAGVLAI